MKGGSEPDDLFKEFKNYFDANYDFLKDNDWFESLSYHIQDTYEINPYEESLLKTICIIVAITYVRLKRGQEEREGVDDMFMELLNTETGLYFPLDVNSGKLNRRMYTDFLYKLYEYSKKHMDTGGIQFEMGPSGKPRLADSSFKPLSLLRANERWYKRTLDDGRRLWTPTEEYEDQAKSSRNYARSINLSANDPLDLNIVGKFSQAPKNKKEVTGPKDEIKKRLDMIEELKEEYNVGSSDEGIYEVADQRLESQGIVTGIKGRKFDMSKFITFATNESSMVRKVKRIKSKAIGESILKYVPYALERLILEIDMGQYGKLDVKGLPDFEYIKERTKYQRIKKGLDAYEGDKKGLAEVHKAVIEIYNMNLEGVVGVGQKENWHYDDMNITPFHAEDFNVDEILGDVHLNLKILQMFYQTINAFTDNVNGSLADIRQEYRAANGRFNPYQLKQFYREFINNMDDLLLQHYAIHYVTSKLYSEGIFTERGESHTHGIIQFLDDEGISWRDNMLKDQKVIVQRLKVVELEFYEKFLYEVTESFTWNEFEDKHLVPIEAKEIIMEMFAHAEILREQLHPTEGNPPLIILPHLRENPQRRFEFYDYKILDVRMREEKQVLKLIEHIIFLDGEILKILQGNKLYMRIYRASESKDVDTLYGIGVERMITQNSSSDLKENVEEYKKLSKMRMPKAVRPGAPLKVSPQLQEKLKYNESMKSELLLEIMTEITEDTEEEINEYINEMATGILKERDDNIYKLNDILSRLYDYVTGGDVGNIMQIAGREHYPDYKFVDVMKKMKSGDTSDVEYKYTDLDSSDPKGAEIVDEDEIVDEWLERKVYRESIKQNKPDYVQKQIEEYDVESDPFGLKPKDTMKSANVPTLKEMDEKQRLRTSKWRGDGELEFITGDKIVGRQQQELYDSGRGEYLTAQPALSRSIKKGSLITNIKRLNKEIMVSDKPRNDPENLEKSKKVITMYRELEGMDEKFLKRGRPTKTPKDMKGLKKGVYKSTPQNINTIKDLLNKSGFDMVSEFASVIDPSLEGNLGEDEERFGDSVVDEPLYEREMKKALIEEITKKLEEESLDDSDVVEMEQQKLDIYNHGKVVEIIDGLDVNSLMDLTYSLFNKYKQYLSKNIINDKQEKLNMLGLLEIQGEEEEIREICRYVILEIIRVLHITNIRGSVFDYNDIFQYTPTEYKLAELNELDNPVTDQYGEPVVDYQNIRSVNPTDFIGKEAEELMGYDLIGTRDGENVYSENPLYRKSETVRQTNISERMEGETFAEYEKRKTKESSYKPRHGQGRGRWGSHKPSYRRLPSTVSVEGGGRKRTNRKRTPQRKRTNRKRTPQRKRTNRKRTNRKRTNRKRTNRKRTNRKK